MSQLQKQALPEMILVVLDFEIEFEVHVEE